MFDCKRCGLDFKQKINLVTHLNRKKICMPIYLDVLPCELMKELNKKDGLECSECKRVYKNQNSLRTHRCKAVQMINNEESSKKEFKTVEKLEIELKEVKEALMKLLNKPIPATTINNIDNSTTNNITNNTLNVQLNCFMDTSGKPIEYLLNSDNLKDKILSWINSKNGLLEYIDEKFYNPEHPENMLIKKGTNDESIKLHISGKWKQLNNIKASDLILTNVGNDFMVYMDTIKENEDDYNKNKKVLKKFENDVMKPLEWGVELSEDSSNMITKTIVKNDKGEYIYLEDEVENDKKLEMTNRVVLHVHNKN